MKEIIKQERKEDKEKAVGLCDRFVKLMETHTWNEAVETLREERRQVQTWRPRNEDRNKMGIE